MNSVVSSPSLIIILFVYPDSYWTHFTGSEIHTCENYLFKQGGTSVTLPLNILPKLQVIEINHKIKSKNKFLFYGDSVTHKVASAKRA